MAGPQSMALRIHRLLWTSRTAASPGTVNVSASVVERTDGPTLREFVWERTAEGAQVYTDEAAAYVGLPRPHATVKHGVGEYVNGQAHTNGIESFWSMLKRGYHGRTTTSAPSTYSGT